MSLKTYLANEAAFAAYVSAKTHERACAKTAQERLAEHVVRPDGKVAEAIWTLSYKMWEAAAKRLDEAKAAWDKARIEDCREQAAAEAVTK